jgi:hypothetical protein
MAARKQSHPTASPYTLCFQTLPAHYRMSKRLAGASASSSNDLLPAGDFESSGDSIVQAGWRYEHRAPKSLLANADLVGVGHNSRSAVRLVSGTPAGQEAPRMICEPLVTLTSPAFHLAAGQVAHVSGWVKTQPLQASTDGLIIYDSLTGRAAARRIIAAGEWERFDLYREAPEGAEMTMHFDLQALGGVMLDDVRLTIHEPLTRDDSPAPMNAGRRASPLDLLPKIPNPWNKERPKP